MPLFARFVPSRVFTAQVARTAASKLRAPRALRSFTAPFVLLASCGLSAAGPALAAGAASALNRVADLDAAARPANVPLDFVVTPNGYFHPSCVVQLAEGEALARGGEVVHADGTRRRIERCLHGSFGARGESRGIVGTDGDAAAAAPAYDGWLAYSYSNYTATPPSNGMTANWTVPAAPSKVSGQTLYFFPGLESAPNVITILQPVLGWNGYGNSSWTMANWNCCNAGTTYSGPPIAVRTGDRIKGTIVGDACEAGQPCSTFRIVSNDLTTKQSTTFRTSAFGQAFNWYFGGVMEVYGVSRCDQLPADGGIDFKKVRVGDVNLDPVVPDWLTSYNTTAPACGYDVTATANETVIRFDPTR